MIIQTADFLCSSQKLAQCPEGDMKEFAFIGRSNVGKSSLINMLTGRKALAKVSGTPGKTRLINHFVINQQWALVDLPGYGYARASKTLREEFSQIIISYVLKRDNMVRLFVLIDCRLEPQKIDLRFIEMLGQRQIPFSLIFTKADKLTQRELSQNLKTYKLRLLEQWEELPEIIVTSSEKSLGRNEVLDSIEKLLE